jgi:hypothetical protein
MADAPALGAGVRKGVEVRILSPTPDVLQVGWPKVQLSWPEG